MLDFDAYLARIGLRPGNSSCWLAIHRAHAASIPFETLDSHRGVPASFHQRDLERKMVAQRRGGYCFEHNLLLSSALEHLGLHVELMLARVRVGDAPAEARPLLTSCCGSPSTASRADAQPDRFGEPEVSSACF